MPSHNCDKKANQKIRTIAKEVFEAIKKANPNQWQISQSMQMSFLTILSQNKSNRNHSTSKARTMVSMFSLSQSVTHSQIQSKAIVFDCNSKNHFQKSLIQAQIMLSSNHVFHSYQLISPRRFYSLNHVFQLNWLQSSVV